MQRLDDQKWLEDESHVFLPGGSFPRQDPWCLWRSQKILPLRCLRPLASLTIMTMSAITTLMTTRVVITLMTINMTTTTPTTVERVDARWRFQINTDVWTIKVLEFWFGHWKCHFLWSENSHFCQKCPSLRPKKWHFYFQFWVLGANLDEP